MKLSTMGGRIKAGRLERGYSVRQLAARLGVKPATVGNWESGRSEPRANKLPVICGLLGVSLMWMLQGADEPGEADLSGARSETAAVHRKLERATALQRELAALLNEATGDIAQLQSELAAGKRRAA